jgi:hypothetical protein
MLRSCASRREENLDAKLPGSAVSRGAGSDPEHEALLLDSVGLALLVVMATLPPAELGATGSATDETAVCKHSNQARS